MLSILHIGSIAGVPQELAHAQRKLGIKSDVLSFDPNPFGYRVDMHHPIELGYSSNWDRYIFNPLKLRKKAPCILRLMGQYDLLHFHYSSAIPFGLDFPLWKMAGKKAVIHHHGSDIRNKGEARMYSRSAHRIFVSTPDLLEWSEKATWIPNPIDLDRYRFVGIDRCSDAIKILHAPSCRDIKGTSYVIKAVEQLKREGYKLDLVMVENCSHSQALELYSQADIVVDQLLIGWYGMFAQECMALGKPVCVYIRSDLEKHMPFCPVINSSTETIADDLRVLIEDPGLRAEMSKKGRKYLKLMHDSNDIAKMVTCLYDDSKYRQ